MTRRTPPPPSPSEILADRLVELRNRHGWTQTELADRMGSHGLTWDRTTVAKIENGTRQVTVDEFVALAYVLGVSPAALITPTSSTAEVSLTATTPTAAPNVWRWLIGTTPLAGGSRPDEKVTADDEPTPEFGVLGLVLGSRRRFYDEAAPDYVVEAERRLPGLRRLLFLVAGVQSLAGAREELQPVALDAAAGALDEIRDDASSLLRKVQRLKKGVTP